MPNKKTIALLGQPNSGKSTIFNALTGSRQHVGNWPGKTVEKKTGSFKKGEVDYEIVDLPGAYALSANSQEEIVTRDYIMDSDIDLVCILADASQLERSMYMLADFTGIKKPAMLLLTMTDVATDLGKKIDAKKLSALIKIPVVEVVSPDINKNEEFFKALAKAIDEKPLINQEALYDNYKKGDIAGQFRKIVETLSKEVPSASNEWVASKILEQDENVINKCKDIDLSWLEVSVSYGNIYVSDAKFSWIESLISDCVTTEAKQESVMTKFDRAATSERWGKPIAVAAVLLTFLVSMLVAAPFMGLGVLLQSVLNTVMESVLPSLGASRFIIDFVKSAFVTPLGWAMSMVGFVFGVNFVFGLVEESGYAARATYVFDGTMNKIGLQGKSIMPMMLGLGCTIAGAAGTRVVDSWGQRILTIMLVWAVPCAATFAVIPSLAITFFGWSGIWVMVLIFAVMLVHIFVTAKLLGKKLNPVESRTGLIMELPPLHKPRASFVLKESASRVWGVFKRAFIIEMVVCIIFFFLSYSSSGIEGSVLYKLGSVIEPVTKFFGMGWQTFLAFVSSMVAKEAVLGVLSAVLANSTSLFDSTLGSRASDANVMMLAANTIGKAEALAFMMAVTFNVPCLQAVVSTYQESHSLKWTLRIAVYYVVTALLRNSIGKMCYSDFRCI